MLVANLDTSLAIALLLMVAHSTLPARCATSVVKQDISREIALRLKRMDNRVSKR
ncbi:hypothetical protein MMC26_000283 [Xylographa opegraphella]|nr:hypothetical protein [Xylographa opegraphella]